MSTSSSSAAAAMTHTQPHACLPGAMRHAVMTVAVEPRVSDVSHAHAPSSSLPRYRAPAVPMRTVYLTPSHPSYHDNSGTAILSSPPHAHSPPTTAATAAAHSGAHVSYVCIPSMTMMDMSAPPAAPPPMKCYLATQPSYHSPTFITPDNSNSNNDNNMNNIMNISDMNKNVHMTHATSAKTIPSSPSSCSSPAPPARHRTTVTRQERVELRVDAPRETVLQPTPVAGMDRVAAVHHDPVSSTQPRRTGGERSATATTAGLPTVNVRVVESGLPIAMRNTMYAHARPAVCAPSHVYPDKGHALYQSSTPHACVVPHAVGSAWQHTAAATAVPVAHRSTAMVAEDRAADRRSAEIVFSAPHASPTSLHASYVHAPHPPASPAGEHVYSPAPQQHQQHASPFTRPHPPLALYTSPPTATGASAAWQTCGSDVGGNERVLLTQTHAPLRVHAHAGSVPPSPPHASDRHAHPMTATTAAATFHAPSHTASPLDTNQSSSISAYALSAATTTTMTATMVAPARLEAGRRLPLHAPTAGAGAGLTAPLSTTPLPASPTSHLVVSEAAVAVPVVGAMRELSSSELRDVTHAELRGTRSRPPPPPPPPAARSAMFRSYGRTSPPGAAFPGVPVQSRATGMNEGRASAGGTLHHTQNVAPAAPHYAHPPHYSGRNTAITPVMSSHALMNNKTIHVSHPQSSVYSTSCPSSPQVSLSSQTQSQQSPCWSHRSNVAAAASAKKMMSVAKSPVQTSGSSARNSNTRSDPSSFPGSMCYVSPTSAPPIVCGSSLSSPTMTQTGVPCMVYGTTRYNMGDGNTHGNAHNLRLAAMSNVAEAQTSPYIARINQQGWPETRERVVYLPTCAADNSSDNDNGDPNRCSGQLCARPL